MKNPAGFIVLALGIILLIYGISASNSFGSGVSKAVTGAPTDKSIWLIIAGLVVSAGGATMIFRGNSRSN